MKIWYIRIMILMSYMEHSVHLRCSLKFQNNLTTNVWWKITSCCCQPEDLDVICYCIIPTVLSPIDLSLSCEGRGNIVNTNEVGNVPFASWWLRIYLILYIPALLLIEQFVIRIFILSWCYICTQMRMHDFCVVIQRLYPQSKLKNIPRHA